MPESRITTPPVGVNRLVALTDGVLAIAMTILVLELGAPAAEELSEGSALGEALKEMWPDFAVYALSFLVLGMFWLMHHAIFDNVIRYDMTLQWLNIIYLMFAALIPFATALFGENGATRWTALFYGLNMLLLVATEWGLWAYTTHKHRLVRPDLEESLIRGGRRMGAVYTGVLVAALALAFLSPLGSFLVYGLVVLGFLLATISGRWDPVMLWPSAIAQSEIVRRRS